MGSLRSNMKHDFGEFFSGNLATPTIDVTLLTLHLHEFTMFKNETFVSVSVVFEKHIQSL